MFRVYIHVSSRGLEGLESRLNARFGERSRRLSSGMLYCVQRSCEAAGITEGPKDRVVRAHARGLANGHGLLDARGTRPERVGRLATAECSSVAAVAARAAGFGLPDNLPEKNYRQTDTNVGRGW